MAWAIRSAALNEFDGSSYDFMVAKDGGGFQRAGNYYLEVRGA